MNKQSIKQILLRERGLEKIRVRGWVRTKRDSKNFSFVELNDGSCLSNLQVVCLRESECYDKLKEISTGASILVEGELLPSEGSKQKWEVRAFSIEILGSAGADYPLQKKGHTLEFLREISHLRPRSNLFGVINRVRSKLSFAIHRFFQEEGFFYIHTPIITPSDCEGAGELFKVTTQDFTREGYNYDEDKNFFGQPTYLTVSGQLEGEVMATALSKIYTFGPTFRAENSHTARHASEFWMIEPEVAFFDLNDNMELAERFLKYLYKSYLEECDEDFQFLNRFICKELKDSLEEVNKPFSVLPYAEAIKILKESGRTFEFPCEYGNNLQSEHERFICEEYMKGPTFIIDFPAKIKPFYMKVNSCGETVRAMDLLVPRVGELIGGSQREENLDILKERMMSTGVDLVHYEWYLDTRRYGTVTHSGFGLGFERLLMFFTGIGNIRDVIPFPRTPGHISF